MSEENKKPGRRKGANYITQILSVALMLLVTGIFASFYFQANRWLRDIKESQSFQVELSKDAQQIDISAVQLQLEAMKEIKNLSFVSKDEALRRLKETTGDVKMELLDENPLYDGFELHLKADNNSEVQAMKIRERIKALPMVKEVHYQARNVKKIDKNIDLITLVILIAAGILALISLFIINSTIRLAMYSNRFLIRSMQLVGATRSFIIRPFMFKGILNGLLSGLIAAAILAGAMLLIESQMPKLNLLKDLPVFIGILCGMIALGMLFSWICTYAATKRYLRVKLDQLY
jgi:cell division transport system permease protein